MSASLFHEIRDLDTEITVPADGKVNRTVFQNDHLKVVLFGFSPGQELSEHSAPMPAIMHFLRGEAKVGISDKITQASAGTWIHMEPDLPHSVTAVTECVMLLLLLKCAKPNKVGLGEVAE